MGKQHIDPWIARTPSQNSTVRINGNPLRSDCGSGNYLEDLYPVHSARLPNHRKGVRLEGLWLCTFPGAIFVDWHSRDGWDSVKGSYDRAFNWGCSVSSQHLCPLLGFSAVCLYNTNCWFYAVRAQAVRDWNNQPGRDLAFGQLFFVSAPEPSGYLWNTLVITLGQRWQSDGVCSVYWLLYF